MDFESTFHCSSDLSSAKKKAESLRPSAKPFIDYLLPRMLSTNQTRVSSLIDDKSDKSSK